ncbi:hypothetical protein cyc_02147 [Cyclospora cayetanensis]|uniref:Uncharacterized protein n=1 Tax=Cyclospora cayetanensis TaxID=88456 RepID=A0A1D3CTX0_9EIME|nr:hypothetical protein cyc_02147 [Cyclospora cayetanensis]
MQAPSGSTDGFPPAYKTPWIPPKRRKAVIIQPLKNLSDTQQLLLHCYISSNDKGGLCSKARDSGQQQKTPPVCYSWQLPVSALRPATKRRNYWGPSACEWQLRMCPPSVSPFGGLPKKQPALQHRTLRQRQRWAELPSPPPGRSLPCIVYSSKLRSIIVHFTLPPSCSLLIHPVRGGYPALPAHCPPAAGAPEEALRGPRSVPSSQFLRILKSCSYAIPGKPNTEKRHAEDPRPSETTENSTNSSATAVPACGSSSTPVDRPQSQGRSKSSQEIDSEKGRATDGCGAEPSGGPPHKRPGEEAKASQSAGPAAAADCHDTPVAVQPRARGRPKSKGGETATALDAIDPEGATPGGVLQVQSCAVSTDTDAPRTAKKTLQQQREAKRQRRGANAFSNSWNGNKGVKRRGRPPQKTASTPSMTSLGAPGSSQRSSPNSSGSAADNNGLSPLYALSSSTETVQGPSRKRAPGFPQQQQHFDAPLEDGGGRAEAEDALEWAIREATTK